MSLCSDANPDETGNAVGEPTECALVNWATKIGLQQARHGGGDPPGGRGPLRLRPEDDVHHPPHGGQASSSTPRAPPTSCSSLCTHYREGRQGPAPGRGGPEAEILAHNKAMADQALRVLAAAERHLRRHALRPVPRRPGARSDLPGAGGHDRPHPPRGEGRHRRVQDRRHPGGDDHRRPPGHRRGHRPAAGHPGARRPGHHRRPAQPDERRGAGPDHLRTTASTPGSSPSTRSASSTPGRSTAASPP